MMVAEEVTNKVAFGHFGILATHTSYTARFLSATRYSAGAQSMRFGASLFGLVLLSSYMLYARVSSLSPLIISSLSSAKLASSKLNFRSLSLTMSVTDIVHNAKIVQERITAACVLVGRDPNSVLLVAVSKTKPASDIMALYEAGFRHFGENYYQELSEKVEQLPADINWHFIGHLQSSKASKLVKDVPNLYSVHTVDTEKLAGKLNNAVGALDDAKHGGRKLRVMIQVMTSEEDTKSGVTPMEAVDLVRYVQTQCAHLHFAGLMTIGAPGDLTCFDRLVACQELVAEQCGIPREAVQLSMGMSGDFEQAVQQGSNLVRVGSTIFGPRIYKS